MRVEGTWPDTEVGIGCKVIDKIGACVWFKILECFG